jgi:hypothetical protein
LQQPYGHKNSSMLWHTAINDILNEVLLNFRFSRWLFSVCKQLSIQHRGVLPTAWCMIGVHEAEEGSYFSQTSSCTF